MAEPIPLTELAEKPVQILKGVGERKAQGLETFGVRTVLDLLTHYPRRYIDRTKEARIADLEIDEEAMVLVEVRRCSTRRIKGGRTMTSVQVGDGSGSLAITFFNQAWRERQLTVGTQAVVFGKASLFRGKLQMSNPIVDLVGDRTGRIVPVYPQSDKAGLSTWEIAGWVENALERTLAVRGFADPLPVEVRRRYDLTDRARAFRGIHLPETMAEAQVARRRLVFDELFRVQLALVRRKREIERTTIGVGHDTSNDPDSLVARFHARLPFPLTGAQTNAVEEIRRDLGAVYPMHRLLQGDVGAGKTLVALSALLVGVQGGYQGALMAPTEVLAEQHYLGVRELLAGFTVKDPATLLGERELRVELLTNRTPGADRRRLTEALATGGVDIVIGTHALIQDAVGFKSLGVVVIDEQHRFGVEQRAALRGKGDGGAVPDVLVMTATPIPRTAAMTVYGDLDVSVLDELPPGRTPIETHWARDEEQELAVWDQVRTEAAAGRQAYVVCPLIEESDKLEVRSAQDTYAELAEPGGELAGLRVGLLHGRVAPAEKEEVMGRFRAGELDVLVATTVIEVGVDVPNATVMVILDADRFGIAQLHQLRGRVGRGSESSWCYLVGEPTTSDGEARLEALVATTDGFELAEIDLELRGEGTLMGERQKGRNDLKLASLRRDREWVERARDVAAEILDADPDLDTNPLLAEELALFLGDEDADFLLKN